MAFFSSVEPIQDWLEDTKMSVDLPLEESVETFMVARVMGALAQRYTVSAWTDDSTTPKLVVKAIAMFYAAALYRRQYSEDLGDTPSWPVWLESTAQAVVDAIALGTMDILDVTPIETSEMQPAFFPTDASTIFDLSNPNYSPRAFTMGMVF